MRPTFDEQLDGAARLLRLAEADAGVTPEVSELIRNARRLIERVASSWAPALPFVRQDNQRTETLLGLAEQDSDDLASAVARNDWLRGELSRRIRDLPPGPERTAIGRHLRDRVAADPTC